MRRRQFLRPTGLQICLKAPDPLVVYSVCLGCGWSVGRSHFTFLLALNNALHASFAVFFRSCLFRKNLIKIKYDGKE